jgi:hypothetical protein
MAVLYLYDVEAKDAREFNRVKRRFYYWLNQIVPNKELWKTKSAIMVPRKYIKPLDALFKEFKGSVICYKANVRTMEELE